MVTKHALPGWRQPHGSLASFHAATGKTGRRERAGLADVLLESMPGTLGELLESACDAWDVATTKAQVGAALDRLVREGAARREAGIWVRA